MYTGKIRDETWRWHGMAWRMALARFIPRPWVQRPHAIPKRPPAAAGTCLDLVVAALSIAYPVPDTCSRGEPFILVSDLFFFVKSKSTTLHSARVRLDSYLFFAVDTTFSRTTVVGSSRLLDQYSAWHVTIPIRETKPRRPSQRKNRPQPLFSAWL
jgi:hypothetical protein